MGNPYFKYVLGFLLEKDGVPVSESDDETVNVSNIIQCDGADSASIDSDTRTLDISLGRFILPLGHNISKIPLIISPM